MILCNNASGIYVYDNHTTFHRLLGNTIFCTHNLGVRKVFRATGIPLHRRRAAHERAWMSIVRRRVSPSLERRRSPGEWRRPCVSQGVLASNDTRDASANGRGRRGFMFGRERNQFCLFYSLCLFASRLNAGLEGEPLTLPAGLSPSLSFSTVSTLL